MKLIIAVTDSMLSRRHLLALPLAINAQTTGPLVDTHIHLFATDTTAFPLHPNSPYKPQPLTVETYAPFATQRNIAHAVIVHPEPYQDDHRYLEYCFEHEPFTNFFKGTCLFDAFDPATPKRIADLQKKWPKRIAALRIHRTQDPSKPPIPRGGPIHDRDLSAPEMRKAWRAAASRGLMIQMHFIPAYAKQIYALAKDFRGMRVILDHLGRGGMGSPEQWKDVLALAKLPNTIVKFSGVSYSSKEPWPHNDAKPRVREAFDAFGPERMIWGGLGTNAEEFRKAAEQLNDFFAFTSEENRAKIRGTNAIQIFGF